MPKTLYRPENTILRNQLRSAREAAGLTQVDLSEAVGKSQTFVSDVERGVRRLDTVELWEICRAMGLDLTSFVAEFQVAIEEAGTSKPRRAKSTGQPRRRA
ncbi:transcriptional regulator [Lysobacter oculi]|uniref:Transcriptional regulator n=1 Tax=Solilutibacter oculi TaxID=2698682 RepID=A0A344J619_9GAMM|nr:transcriptional regulator [Lysobacter oculi]